MYHFGGVSFNKHNLCSDETRPPTRKMRPLFFDRAAELKRRFPIAPKVNCTTLLYRAGWVGGLSKVHAHKRLCSKMAKDTKFARVLKATLPPTKQCKLVILTPLRSVPHHNLCSDETRPPTRKMRPLFLDRAAELKRRFPIAPHNLAV